MIGVPPGDLQPPPPLPTLPRHAPIWRPRSRSPTMPISPRSPRRARAAGYRRRASRRGARLPTISANSTARAIVNALGTGRRGGGQRRRHRCRTAPTSTGVGLSLTVPLYQGGAAGARVRQAQALRGQLLEQAIGVERLVVSNARAAFATYRAALRGDRNRTQIAVAANQLALEGTRAEQTVGTRNVLDVLNAEQELLNSQVLLVTARRDAYVAGFQLLNAMGLAEAEDLNLDGGPLYDPLVNYNRYVAQLVGLGRRADDPRRSRPAPRRPDANSPVTPIVTSRDRAAAISDKSFVMGDIQQDPSMEEILASIKRVIAEDGRAARDRRRAARPSAPRRRAAEPSRRRGRAGAGRSGHRGSGLLSDDAAAASRERLASLSALRQRGELPPDAERARGGGARHAAADAEGMARPASARDRRGAGHPRDRPDHRPRALGPLLAGGAAVLGRRRHEKAPRSRALRARSRPGAAAAARPITATDLATMRRLGAPAVSPDGNWVVYQLRETDLEANRGRTDLWLLDLRAAGRRAGPDRLARPSITSMTRASPPTGAGSIISATPRAATSSGGWRCRAGRRSRSPTSAPTSPAICSRRAATGSRSGPTATCACADFNCANVAGRRAPGRAAAGSMTRPSCATGTPGRPRACARASSPSRWSTAGRRARARRSRPSLVGDSPSKPFGGAEELAWSPDGRTLYFTLREGGRTEPNSTNLDIYAGAADGGAAPTNLTAANRGTGHRPRRLARRPLARLHRDGARRPTRRTGRSSSCATSQPARPAR